MHVESTPVVSQSLMRPSVCETVGINVHGLLLSVLGSPRGMAPSPTDAGEKGASQLLPGNQHILPSFIPSVQVITCPAQVLG